MFSPLLLSLGLLILHISYTLSVGSTGNPFMRAVQLTMLEQETEDTNSVHRIADSLQRRLICLPINDNFATSAINGMHGKIQHGDKCSLPASIGRLIFGRPYEVPWLFEVTPVAKTGSSSTTTTTISNPKDPAAAALTSRLRKVYVSPLDFRAPENYVFLPRWVMDSLALAPFDLADVSFVRIKLAALVVLQPLNLEWDLLVEGGRDPKSILEQEVNKYSSLTAGAVISIEYQGTVYRFFVKQTQAEGGVAVRGVRVQDSDIKVDIDRGYLDELKRKLEEEEALEGEEAQKQSEKKDRQAHKGSA